MVCNNCGSNIPDDSMFCLKCGSKVEADLDNNVIVKTFPLCGNSVSFYDDIIEFNNIRTNFVEFARKSRSEYINFYNSKIKNFDDLYDIALPKFLEYIAESVRFGIFILMENGIDYIDEKALIDYMDDDELRVQHVLNMFSEYADNIQKAVDELAEYRHIQRSSRSRWQGGGFGISGALKGALTAGAFNMATNAVRGIGDSLTDSSDREKINNLKKRVATAKENLYILSQTIYSAYMTVFIYVYNILVSEDIMPGMDFDTEMLEPRINNYMALYSKGSDVYEKLIGLLIDAIEIYPYDPEYYADLYKVAKVHRDSIYPLAKFFDIDEEYLSLIEDFDKERIAKINETIGEDNIKSINMKIEALEIIQAENPGIDNSKLIERLKEKKRYV